MLHVETPPPPEQPKGLGRLAIGIILLLFAALGAGLIAVGIFPRLRSDRHQEEAQATFGNPEPGVAIIEPKLAKSEHTLTLPGSLEAFQEISVNARADGYVKQWLVDIGDHVRAGQTLAILEAPELEQQLSEAAADVEQAQSAVFQARADLHRTQAEQARLRADEEKARAQVEQTTADIEARESDEQFAKVTNERWQKLAAQQAISLEDADKRASAYRSARANVLASKEQRTAAVGDVNATLARQVALKSEILSAAAKVRSAEALVVAKQAVVRRYEAEIGFLHVTAPFAGTITARPIDVGSLVSAGGDHTTLFRLARRDRLRLFLDVPENDVPSIHVGMKASLKFREFKRPLIGVITRTAGSLDNTTRTLKTQIELNNPGYLDPGMNADVSLDIKLHQEVFVLPSTALVIRTAGPKVVLLGPDDRVHYVNIEEGLDYGRQVEVIRGLHQGDRVVDFPSDALVDGMKVKPLAATSAKS